MSSYFLKYPVHFLPSILGLAPIVIILVRTAYVDKAVRILLLYFMVKIVIDCFAIKTALSGKDNLYICNIWTTVSYLLLSFMFWSKYEQRLYRILMVCMFIIFMMVLTFDLIRDGVHNTLRYTGLFQCCFIVAMVIIYFRQLIYNPVIPHLFSDPFYWICAGLITYYSPCIVTSVLGYYIDSRISDSFMDIFITIPHILESVYIIIISIGLFSRKFVN